MEHAGTQQVPGEQDRQVEESVLEAGQDARVHPQLREVEEPLRLQQPEQRLLRGQVPAAAEDPLSLLLMTIVYISYDHQASLAMLFREN